MEATSTIPMSIPKPTALLKDSETWGTWYQSLRVAAQSYQVWDQINPDTPISTPNTTPTTIPSSNDGQLQEISALQSARHLAAVYTWMQATVDPLLWSSAILKETPREILLYLKEACEPTMDEKLDQFLAKYSRMTTIGPKNQNLEVYNLEFARMVVESEKIIGYNHSSQKWAQIYTRSLVDTHQNLYLLLSPHVVAPNSLKFLEILSLSRRYIKELNLNKTQKRGAFNAAFPSLGNSDSANQLEASKPSDSAQTPRRCAICSGPHILRLCYYLVESIRTPNWKPKQEIMDKLASRRKRDPNFDNRCKEAIELTQKRLQSTTIPEKPANPITLTAIIQEPSSQALSIDQHGQFDRNNWILDSGANVHVCNNRNSFIHLEPCNQTLQTGGGTTQITERGIVVIIVETANSSFKELRLINCIYAPNVPLNLLSLSLAIEKGFFFSRDMQWLRTPQSPQSIRLQLQKGLFYIVRKLEPEPQAMMISSAKIPRDISSYRQWHERLGHAGQEAISKLPEAVIGVELKEEPPIDSTLCQTCAVSKITAQISRLPAQRAMHSFHTISMDLIELSTGYNNDRYCLHVVDSFSSFHMVWNLPSKHQDQILPCIYNLYRLALNWGHPIQVIRLDGEPGLREAWDQFTALRGIQPHVSSPYTSDQNGAAERAGRMIIECARSLRVASGMPHSLWPEFIRSAAFLLNRTPNRRLGWRTPFEFITGRRPTLSYIRKLGSVAYTLNKNVEKSQKLQERAEIGYLVGYDTYNIFRIYLPTNGRVIRSRDVILDESHIYKDHYQLQQLEIPARLEDLVNTMEVPEPDIFEVFEIPPNDTNPLENTSKTHTNQVPNQLSESAQEQNSQLVTPPATPLATQSSESNIDDTVDTTQSDNPSHISDEENGPQLDEQSRTVQTRDISQGIDPANIIEDTSNSYSLRSRTRQQGHLAAINNIPASHLINPSDPLYPLFFSFFSAITDDSTGVETKTDEIPLPRSYKEAIKHPYHDY
jgi:Pol polyprotein